MVMLKTTEARAKGFDEGISTAISTANGGGNDVSTPISTPNGGRNTQRGTEARDALVLEAIRIRSHQPLEQCQKLF